MEIILQFFSNLILFTFGLAVLIFWIVILFVVVDEIIDLVLNWRKIKEEDKS